MDRGAPLRGSTRISAVAAAAALLASGCVPSRFVAARAPEAPDRALPVPERTSEPGPPPPPGPPVPGTPRSLEDLVDLALSRDPTTRSAWHEARAASAAAGGSRSTYLPTIDLTGTFERGQSATGAATDETLSTAGTVSASLTWLLLDLGQRAAAVRESDRLALAAGLAHRAAVADLILAVQEDYYAYLAALALVEAQRSTVTQAQTSLAAAEDRRRAGVATVADVLQARTALSQARLVLQQIEGGARVRRGQLAATVGLSPTADLEVGALPSRVAVGPAAPEVDALLAAAATRNPDLARARAIADADEAGARAAARAGLPTLSGQAGAARIWYVAPEEDTADAWYGGLVVRFPLFEGFRTRFDAHAARERAAASRARAEATAQSVAVAVWSSYQSVRTAVLRVETSSDLLASATASAEVADARYKEGVGSILDLLNAQSALALARAEDVLARTDFFVSLARLARATGRLPPAQEASPAAAQGASQ
jgi:outer membrane protein TolC